MSTSSVNLGVFQELPLTYLFFLSAFHSLAFSWSPVKGKIGNIECLWALWPFTPGMCFIIQGSTSRTSISRAFETWDPSFFQESVNRRSATKFETSKPCKGCEALLNVFYSPSGSRRQGESISFGSRLRFDRERFGNLFFLIWKK